MTEQQTAAIKRLRYKATAYNTSITVATDDVRTLLAAHAALVERVRRYEMFAAHNAAYAELRNDPEAWAAELAERTAWDVTLMDGLDDAAPPPAGQTGAPDAQ